MWFLIHRPAVQSYGIQQVTQYVSDKTGTRCEVAGIDLDFFKTLVLEGVYLEDLKGDTLLNVGRLGVDMGVFALLQQEIYLNEVFLEQGRVKLLRKDSVYNFDFLVEAFASSDTLPADSVEVAADTTASEPIAWKLGLGDIRLEGIDVDVVDQTDGYEIFARLGRLGLTMDELDLNAQRVALDEIELSDTELAYLLFKAAPPDTTSSDSLTFPQTGWDLSLGDLRLENLALDYHDYTQPETDSAFNPAHLVLRGLNLGLEDVRVNDEAMGLELADLRFRDQSGLSVEGWQGEVTFTPTQAELKDFALRTSRSELRPQLRVRYPALQTFLDSIPDLLLDLNLDGTAVDWQDLALFAPDLRQSLALDSAQRLRLGGRARGSLTELTVQNLRLRSGSTLQLSSQATVREALNPDSLRIDFTLDSLQAQLQPLNRLLRGILPAEALALQQIDYRARYQGSLTGGQLDGNLQSALGQLSHAVEAAFNADYSDGSYDATVDLADFDLGPLLANDTLGQVSLQAQVNGQGLDPAQMDTRYRVEFQRLDLFGYAYQPFSLQGDLIQNQLSSQLRMADPNLALALDLGLDLRDSLMGLRVEGQLDTLNLQALRLSPDELTLRTGLRADLKGLDPDQMQGEVALSQLSLSNERRFFTEENFILSLDGTADESRQIRVQSALLQANMQGRFRLATLADDLTRLVDGYYPLRSDSLRLADSVASPTDLSLSLALSQPTRLTQLFAPGLTRLDTLHFSAEAEADAGQLRAELWIPELTYDSFRVAQLRLQSRTEGQALMAELGLDSLYGAALTDPLGLQAQARVGQERFDLDLDLSRDTLARLLALGLQGQPGPEGLEINLKDKFYLNHQPWQVEPGHYLRLTDEATVIHQLGLTRKVQRLVVDGNTVDSLSIDFERFDLREISRLLSLQDYDVSGSIQGQVDLRQLDSQPYFLTDLTLAGLRFNQDEVGDWRIRAETDEAGQEVRVDSRLSGANQLALKGSYGLANEQLDLDLDLERFNLALAEPFATGAAHNLKGYLVADLSVSGSPTQPNLKGKVGFREAAAVLDYLNTYYQFPQEDIGIEPDRLVFDQFTLRDSVGREAQLSGVILHEYFDNIRLDLDFNSDEFLFLDTGPEDNELFYGRMLLNLSTQITGTPDDIKVNAQARSLPGTELTVLTPEDEAQLTSEDYVIFVPPERFNQLPTPDSVVEKEKIIPYRARREGVTIDLNLELTPETQLTYVIDPVTGDKAQIRGDAQLSLNLDERGEISLLGVFEVAEGSYNFSYESLVTKSFQIQPGSRISFPGDPYEADLDFTAIYTTRTTTYDLLRNELADPNGPVATAAKRRTPVNVLLQMKGELFEPQLSFDIQLPEQSGGNAVESAVSRKLAQIRQDESELNKQVFGLILLGGFVNTGPSAGSSTGLEGVAVSSVSSFLNGQLNDLAERYVSGVQVDINLDSYKSEFDDQNTLSELEVGLSRQLFNERLTVSVGTEIGLESSSYTEASDTELTQLTGNFVLRYRLTEDGRYNLRVFNKSDSDSPLGGSGNTRIRTGAGASFRKAFD